MDSRRIHLGRVRPAPIPAVLAAFIGFAVGSMFGAPVIGGVAAVGLWWLHRNRKRFAGNRSE